MVLREAGGLRILGAALVSVLRLYFGVKLEAREQLGLLVFLVEGVKLELEALTLRAGTMNCGASSWVLMTMGGRTALTSSSGVSSRLRMVSVSESASSCSRRLWYFRARSMLYLSFCLNTPALSHYLPWKKVSSRTNAKIPITEIPSISSACSSENWF